MRYAGIKYNDIVDCDDGICVSFWTQGCPFHCKGCHNPQTWDFDGGEEKPIDEIVDEILKAISSNRIMRNFSILGGEPLCPQNLKSVCEIIERIRKVYPFIKIYLWTGYTIEELQNRKEKLLEEVIFKKVNILIDGRYIDEIRDITLHLRGSSNQRIISLNN